MSSGRERLLEAARSLLAEHPEQEPSTRELYEAADVGAPTLYHHFGDKAGLLEAVTDEAFAAYLERKHGVPRTGDPLADFAAGWDMHVDFGVQNPVLYALMYRREEGRRSRAAQTAEAELRRGLERLSSAGLLRVGVDEAMAVTTAMAIGCVTQLIHDGGSAAGPVARTMRTALLSQLTGQGPGREDAGPGATREDAGHGSGREDARQGAAREDAGLAARLLLARLGAAPGLFTAAEEALLRQWLLTLAGTLSQSHQRKDENRDQC